MPCKGSPTIVYLHGSAGGRDSADGIPALLEDDHRFCAYDAARYPREVVGMVLLDSALPAYLGIYKRLYPPGSGPQPGEWRDEPEQLDRLATFRQAARHQGRKVRIPVTYIATPLAGATARSWWPFARRSGRSSAASRPDA